MIFSGWILYAVLSGGIFGKDLTIHIQTFNTLEECHVMASAMQDEDYYSKNGYAYDYYCGKDPKERV